VVRNKTVPAEILRRLAADSAHDVRLAVATKNKLPEDLMMLLAADVDESVRERVAFNKNAPTAILEHLANDPIERIALKARTRLATGTFRAS
jgi:phosphoserine phosphatase